MPQVAAIFQTSPSQGTQSWPLPQQHAAARQQGGAKAPRKSAAQRKTPRPEGPIVEPLGDKNSCQVLYGIWKPESVCLHIFGILKGLQSVPKIEYVKIVPKSKGWSGLKGFQTFWQKNEYNWCTCMPPACTRTRTMHHEFSPLLPKKTKNWNFSFFTCLESRNV